MLTRTNNKVMLTDVAYSVGKKLVQVVLPATGALYFGLASIWGLPAAEQVVGTLAVITTFLGMCLGLSSRQYDASGAGFDGKVVITQPEGGRKMFSLEVDGDPEEIEKKSSITFKVDSRNETSE